MISPATADEKRTWTDNTGKFRVEATFVHLDGENVVLQSVSDGKQMTLPLTRLSDADQKYVKGLGKTPSAQAGRSSRQEPSSSNTTGKTDLPTPVRISLRTVPQPKLNKDLEWNCPADPEQVGELSSPPQPFTFTHDTIPGSFVTPNHSNFYFNRDRKILAFAINMTNIPMNARRAVDNPVSFNKLWIAHVPTGRTIETVFDDKEKLVLTGIATGGGRVAFRSGKWGDPYDRGFRNHLYIGDVTNSGVVINKAFAPFADLANPDGKGNEDDIEWADWVSNNNILVCTRKLLIMLDVNQGRAVWKRDIGFSSEIILSPGKRYALVAGVGEVFLLDAATGDGIGQLDTMGATMNLHFAFSPDGKMIASNNETGVYLWDVTNGQIQEPFYVGDGLINLQWCDNRYIMTGTKLVDTELKAPAWIYDNNTPGFGRAVGGLFWYATSPRRDRRDTTNTATIKIQGVTLPHPEAIQKLSQDTSRFIVAPGTSVALVLDPSVVNGRAAVQRSMEDKISENGWILDDNATITMTLHVISKPEETVSYISIGPGRGEPEVIKYQPRVYQAEIKHGDMLLWSLFLNRDAPTFSPGRMHRNATMQEYVDWLMETYDIWFQGLNIPKTIADPAKVGRSRLTENGITPDP